MDRQQGSRERRTPCADQYQTRYPDTEGEKRILSIRKWRAMIQAGPAILRDIPQVVHQNHPLKLSFQKFNIPRGLRVFIEAAVEVVCVGDATLQLNASTGVELNEIADILLVPEPARFDNMVRGAVRDCLEFASCRTSAWYGRSD